MPTAVFPLIGRTPGRPLPYKDWGALVELDGTVLVADLPCSVWPATRQSAADSGEAFDHTGECPRGYAAQIIDTANLTIVLEDDRRFRIVGAVEHTMVPHIGLELRRMVPGG
jgi:hypothetical protein